MQFLGLNSKHFSISASYSMCECVKTMNAYYYGVRSDLKLEMCSFVMSFNNGAVWQILVMDLADLSGIAGMQHQQFESTKGEKLFASVKAKHLDWTNSLLFNFLDTLRFSSPKEQSLQQIFTKFSSMHLMEIHKQALRAFKDIDIVQEYQYFMGLPKADDLL